jgi:hypothetical protein
MPQVTPTPPAAALACGHEPPGGYELLYKTDHPRSIDRYINFFGDGAPHIEAGTDCCGDVVLSLA